MSPHQRRERLRLEITTATMRLDWAIAEAKRNPTTPALIRFIKDSREERRALKAKLANLDKMIKLEELGKELKISN
jgi:hypothetical protein